MVNCLNVKKYILSIVSENFAVSVSQKVSDTKSKSRDLSRLVSIPYILYFSNFAIVFKLLLCLSPWCIKVLISSLVSKLHDVVFNILEKSFGGGCVH
jgi:hypothetical protein